MGSQLSSLRWPSRPQPPSPSPFSSSTLFIIAHKSVSVLPSGKIYETWALHSRTNAEPIDIDTHIAICHSSADLYPNQQTVSAIATATITDVAYCDAHQIVFRMQITKDNVPSLLSMALNNARIGFFKKIAYRLASILSPSPPPLPSTQDHRRRLPSKGHTLTDGF